MCSPENPNMLENMRISENPYIEVNPYIQGKMILSLQFCKILFKTPMTFCQ